MSQDNYVREQINAVKKNSDLIILGMLWIISLITLFATFFTDYVAPVRTYIGIGGLALVTIWRLIKRKNFKIVLAIFLFLGCIGLIQFSIATVYWGDSDDSTLRLQYSPLSIVLFVLLIAMNVNSINTMHKTPDGEPEKRSIQSENYLNKYYHELKEKDDNSLIGIISTRERWQKEYIEAAEKILEERK